MTASETKVQLVSVPRGCTKDEGRFLEASLQERASNHWVLDLDIKGFFDNIDHDLLMRAVRKHTDCKWVLLYIERWLKAPAQLADGSLINRDKGTPQGGVVSPLLANLFLHYAFDLWMKRQYPQIPFEGYADDGICHCRSKAEAERLRVVIEKRFAECGLELNLQKTKIVCCNEDGRRGDYPNQKFDFLGFTFQPRRAKNRKDSDIKYEAVDAGRIFDEMANAANGMNIVILDACRDNPFSRQFRSASRGLAIVGSAPTGTYISYSTGPGQVALDGDGRNSPFAAALMQYMKEPGLTIEQVFKNVRHKLGQETAGKQVPWELSSLEGDFFFLHGSPAKTGTPRDMADSRYKGATGTRPSMERSSSEQATFRDTVTGMDFILVNGSCFQMGDGVGDGLPSEKPIHEVCLDSFYLGKYEVTQGQWKKVMGTNPSHFKACGDQCPVENVKWTDVQSFIAELNGLTGQTYRLPTEAEWEYVARDGGKMVKWAGTSSEIKLGDFAWYDENSGDKTHPAGLKKPNALGFYDMSGNVWEWTGDWYAETYYQKSARDNPRGPNEGTDRVLRGGCWLDRAKDCRTTIRFNFNPANAFKSIGFRLVRQLGTAR